MRHAVQRSSLMAAPALAELAKAPERRRIVEIMRLSSPKKAVRRLRQLVPEQRNRSWQCTGPQGHPLTALRPQSGHPRRRLSEELPPPVRVRKKAGSDQTLTIRAAIQRPLRQPLLRRLARGRRKTKRNRHPMQSGLLIRLEVRAGGRPRSPPISRRRLNLSLRDGRAPPERRQWSNRCRLGLLRRRQ